MLHWSHSWDTPHERNSWWLSADVKQHISHAKTTSYILPSIVHLSVFSPMSTVQDAIKEFERQMADLVQAFIEHVQGLTAQCRELENQHHEKLLETSIITLEKVVKNELEEEIDDDLREVCVCTWPSLQQDTDRHGMTEISGQIVLYLNGWSSVARHRRVLVRETVCKYCHSQCWFYKRGTWCTMMHCELNIEAFCLAALCRQRHNHQCCDIFTWYALTEDRQSWGRHNRAN